MWVGSEWGGGTDPEVGLIENSAKETIEEYDISDRWFAGSEATIKSGDFANFFPRK